MICVGIRPLADIARWIARPFVPSHYLLSRDDREPAELLAIRDENVRTRTLVLRPRRPRRRHRAGQFVRVDVAGVHGWFAITSGEDRFDGELEITVNADHDRWLYAAPPGSTVLLGIPEGDFVYTPLAPTPTLMVTGGAAITSVIGMLRTFATRDAMPDVAHVHVCASRADALFGDELAALAARFASYRPTTIYRTDDRRPLDHTRLGELVGDWASRAVWLAGPPRMQAAIAAAWAAIDRVAALHIARPPGESAGGTIVLRGDPATPLLDTAEAAGFAVRSGCRIGVCRSCVVTLRRGVVRDLRSGQLTGEPGARIQLCVTAPRDAECDIEVAP